MRNSTTTTTTRAGRGTAAGRKIIASLTEAVEAAERGETSPPGSFVRPDVELPDEPGVYPPELIRALRDRHQATQHEFARMIGVSTAQVQSLETGAANRPGSSAACSTRSRAAPVRRSRTPRAAS